jgi:hypothetical protein
VLHLAAKEFGCDEETIAARSERVTSFWMCVQNYNLSIDTSLQPLDDIADLIIDLSAKQRHVADTA